MRKLKNYFLLTLILVLIAGANFNELLSQIKMPPAPVGIFYSNSNGNTNNPQLTTIKPEEKPKDPNLVHLETQLESARTLGNTIAVKQIQSQIDNLLGNVIVHQPCVNTDVQYNNIILPLENDYNLNQIHPWLIWSHAFGIAPTGSNIAGRIFCAIEQEAASGGQDTLKILYSLNNGTNWIPLMYTNLTPNPYTFNKNELDIEVVYDGTNTWIFGVVGITTISNGLKKVIFFRQKADGAGFYNTILNFPGSTNGMHYYNPRITSDNSIYLSNAFVSVICSMDSTAGPNHYAKQKFMYSTTPFDPVPGFNYAQPNGTNGFYWATYLGTNTNVYLYGDISYYKDDPGTGLSRLITVYNCYNSGFNSIYIAYLSGYGGTIGNLVVTEPNLNKDVKIAFNGGTSNRNGLITYLRQYNTADWDIYGLRTTNGGSLLADWRRDTIDWSNNRIRTNDIIAIRGGSSQFRICYAEDNPSIPVGSYKTFNGTFWSGRQIMTNAVVDTIYTEPKAGYILGGGDDGIGIWSISGGHNGYCSKNMETTTGITHNQLPTEFLLTQNYPNPFNPSTKIKFALPSSVNVSLRIFDITGKQVAELVNGSLPAGTHEYTFDAGKLSSGVYFYKLEAKGFTQVKKMILAK